MIKLNIEPERTRECRFASLVHVREASFFLWECCNKVDERGRETNAYGRAGECPSGLRL